MKEQLEALIQQMVEKGVRYDTAVQDFEKHYISRVLERVKGNQSRAARMLGMHRNTLSRKINEYGVSLDFRHMPARPTTGRAMQAVPSTINAGRGTRSAWG